MKIKHKLLSDYQYTNFDKKIFVLKSGTILEEYNYNVKGDSIYIDKEIVEANPQIFSLIDWKMELLSYMKVNKMPQPAQLGKKLIPFIEEMVLSSVSQSTGPKLDHSKIKELEEKETELFKEDQNLKRIKAALEAKEKRVKDLEEEIEIRLKRLEKKEEDSKNDLEVLEKRELELRDKNRELIDKNLELDDKLQDIRELERNINLNSLKSSEEIDLKYAELQSRMDSDLKKLSEGEKDLELKLKEVSKREKAVEKNEEEWNKKWNSIKEKEEQLELFQGDLLRLNTEIQNWENLHWKFKRNIVPPSAISETMNPNISFN
jgi:DNA repair exonuclease SbcCD ATPase subunit